MNNFHDDVLDVLEESLETISSAIDDILFTLGIDNIDVATRLNDEAMIAITKKLSIGLNKNGYGNSATVELAMKDFIRG